MISEIKNIYWFKCKKLTKNLKLENIWAYDAQILAFLLKFRPINLENRPLYLKSGLNTTDIISLRYMQWHEYVRSRPKDVSHLVPFAHAKRTGKVIARLPLRYWCSLTHPVGGHPPWIITEKTQGGHTRRNWWIFWYLEIWIKNQEKVVILISNCSHLNHYFIYFSMAIFLW